MKFLSNESCVTPARLALRLSKLGIPVDPRNVFTPLSAAVSFLKEHKLRPHLLVHESKFRSKIHFDSLSGRLSVDLRRCGGRVCRIPVLRPELCSPWRCRG